MSTNEPKPTFTGVPLIRSYPERALDLLTGIPSMPQSRNDIIGFLTGKFGEAVFIEYRKYIKKYVDNARRTLDVLRYDPEQNVITGSNPFAVAVINELPIIKKHGLSVATQADLEFMLKGGDALHVAGNHYINTGLVLRSEDDPNNYLAKIIAAEIKERTKQDPQYSLLIHLRDVRVEPDPNSPYSLVFKLNSDAKPLHTPILNKYGCFYSQDIDAQTGLPKETTEKIKERSRCLLTNEHGLVRMELDKGFDLFSNLGSLSSSNSDGRVTVVGAKRADSGALSFADVDGEKGLLSLAQTEGELSLSDKLNEQ